MNTPVEGVWGGGGGGWEAWGLGPNLSQGESSEDIKTRRYGRGKGLGQMEVGS